MENRGGKRYYIPCGYSAAAGTVYKNADLCVLLGNAFDNALEASRFVEEGSD
ncbi:GHKL domain-containing protein [Enterocloster citroniae]|uniref:GHKL domain-containing protein n=1 Tax=Enterocloster citroniae TaxID=358743 RepID=UPI0032BF79A0